MGRAVVLRRGGAREMEGEERREKRENREREGEDVCLSGGADGADFYFGKQAEKSQHTVVHYGFAGMRSECKIEVLSSAQLEAAMPYVKKCAVLIKRSPPAKEYVKQLIQRNYYQIKTCQTCYAVTRWNLEKGKTTVGRLGGGTGWAVGMAIITGVRHIYLYDLERLQWYSYSQETRKWKQLDPDQVPLAKGRYSGIGSRNLGPEGEAAIRWLYQR